MGARQVLQPMFASERTAARLLDMQPDEFRALVRQGALPPPLRLGKHERWSVEAIAAIVNGTAPKHDGGLTL